MAAPLRGRRPKRRERPDKRCMTPGCGTVLAHRWKWLCDPCFRSLPFARRKAIAEACQAREPQRVFGLCRDAGEFLADQRAKVAEGA
jgi:hypothetical protein